MLVHATCVAVREQGVLLTGASGSGKSDLALRLMMDGALLVADDQVDVLAQGGRLVASPPPVLRGMIEIRHMGLFRVPCCEVVDLALVVDLIADPVAAERLPEAVRAEILGLAVPRVTLPAFAASTPAKMIAALSFERVSES